MASGIFKLGAFLVALGLWGLLAGEYFLGEGSLFRTWAPTILLTGAALAGSGTLLGLAGRLGSRILPSRCTRCGRRIERGQAYCADHLKEAVDEAREALRGGASLRGSGRT